MQKGLFLAMSWLFFGTFEARCAATMAAPAVVVTPYEVKGALLKIPSSVVLANRPLSLTGYGVRKKKVVFVNVSVYVASHYVSDLKEWNPADPIASLKKQPERTLNLVFMRAVSGDKIRGAFVDSLKTNGLDPNRKDLSQVLDALAVNVEEGNEVSLTAVGGGKNEQTLSVRGPKGTVQVKGGAVVDDTWSIWFGKSDDGGLEDLKAQLVGGQK